MDILTYTHCIVVAGSLDHLPLQPPLDAPQSVWWWVEVVTMTERMAQLQMLRVSTLDADPLVAFHTHGPLCHQSWKMVEPHSVNGAGNMEVWRCLVMWIMMKPHVVDNLAQMALTQRTSAVRTLSGTYHIFQPVVMTPDRGQEDV